jgi:hypothetical protein
MEKGMIVKMLWERCHDFVVEEEDAFLVEASADEATGKLLPLLSQRERMKFEQMKDFYVAKTTEGKARAGSYYFLVSRGAKEIKFESVALLSSDLSARGGRARFLPDIPISCIDDLDTIDPEAR